RVSAGLLRRQDLGQLRWLSGRAFYGSRKRLGYVRHRRARRARRRQFRKSRGRIGLLRKVVQNRLEGYFGRRTDQRGRRKGLGRFWGDIRWIEGSRRPVENAPRCAERTCQT